MESAGCFYGPSSVINVVIDDGGFNCSCPSGTYSLIFTSAGNDTGTGALGTYTLLNGVVSSINIAKTGTGYLLAPTVSLNVSTCSRNPNMTVQLSYGDFASGHGRG